MILTREITENAQYDHPGRYSMNFKKILVPLDQSGLAERALTIALRIAVKMSAENIVMLHMVVSLDLDLVLYKTMRMIRKGQTQGASKRNIQAQDQSIAGLFLGRISQTCPNRITLHSRFFQQVFAPQPSSFHLANSSTAPVSNL